MKTLVNTPAERKKMLELDDALAGVLASRFDTNLARVRELGSPFSEKQFWAKPYPYGNSFGHLVLHLTGNLNYYIGAQIANTGYVRNRDREFTEPTPPSKAEALRSLGDAVAMAIEVVHTQSPVDWSRAYSAINTNCTNRLDMILQCAAHMQHHIGQMIYICHEWQRRQGATSSERSVT